MSLLTEDIEQAVHAEIQAFTKEIHSEVVGNLRNFDISQSQELEQSLRMQITRDATSLQNVLSVNFATHGTVVSSGQRILPATPPLTEMIEWIKGRGLAAFKFVPGYKNKIPTQDVAIRRLAFMFIRKKQQGGMNFKSSGRDWFYGPFFSLWKEYRANIVDKFTSLLSQGAAKEMEAALFKRARKK